MFRSAPVWGIGIGRFFGRSGPLAGARLATLLGGGHDRENAHNNFLQVLAEQGLVGLAAFVLVLGAVAWGGIRDELATPDFRRFWLLIALFGCLLTWLTGHPMLVPEFAFVFWIYLALLSSFTAPPRIPGAPWIAMLVVLCVIASVPIRAISELRNADLEYLAVGMSQWQHDDVIAYRRGGTMFSLYVPATGTLVAIPAKRAAGTPDPLLLELRLDGHLINSIPLGGDEWQTLSFTAPSVKRRFVLIDFLVPNAPTASNRESDLVHLGKPSGR